MIFAPNIGFIEFSEVLIVLLVRLVRSFMVTAGPDYSLIGRSDLSSLLLLYILQVFYFFGNPYSLGPTYAHLGLIPTDPPTAVSHTYEWGVRWPQAQM